MTNRVRLGRRRVGAIAAFATVPAIVLATALTPCTCPEHADHAAGVVHAAPHTAAGGGAPGHGASQHGAPPEHAMRWVVGSERAPLVTRGAPGPLWLGTERAAPGSTAHGTYAAQYVARQLADRRAASLADPQQQLRARLGLPLVDPANPADPVASRAALTTSQATAQLSRRCRKLLKAKRPSRLSKADRRKRAACLKQRRQLIADSRTQPATPTPTPTPIAPTATTPASTTPAATPTPTPTPAANPCAGKNPCYGAVGVKAIDNDEAFSITRTTVTADIVNFELQNVDSQDHNLYIAPTDASGTINGTIREIFDRTPQRTTTPGVDVPLAPGRYKLICTIALNHEPMTVTFTVQAPQR